VSRCYRADGCALSQSAPPPPVIDHALQLQPLIVLQFPSHAHMDWTHGCGWGLWGSSQKASRGLADWQQIRHSICLRTRSECKRDLWSEATDWCGCNILGSAHLWSLVLSCMVGKVGACHVRVCISPLVDSILGKLIAQTLMPRHPPRWQWKRTGLPSITQGLSSRLWNTNKHSDYITLENYL